MKNRGFNFGKRKNLRRNGANRGESVDQNGDFDRDWESYELMSERDPLPMRWQDQIVKRREREPDVAPVEETEAWRVYQAQIADEC